MFVWITRNKFKYASVPNDYDDTYQQLTRQGARVLALAIKEVGTLSYQEVIMSFFLLVRFYLVNLAYSNVLE